MREILEMAAGHFRKQMPFVVFSQPDSGKIDAMFQNGGGEYYVSDFSESGFIFSPFDGNDRLLIPYSHSQILASDLQMTEAISSAEATSAAEKAKKSFEALVAKGIEAIRRGEFGKVVLSRKESVELGTSDFVTIFKRLLATYPSAFRYCWFHPKTGIWMGATPERLLKAEGFRFSTVALAGTKKFDGSNEVEWPEKEQAEQRFVTEFITSGLGEKASDLNVSEPYTARAGNLLHIKTDIDGTLSEQNELRDVLAILHPTPAVCGYPKDLAKSFILQNEGYDREFYTGYLGMLNMESPDEKLTDIFVNLRCMKISGNTAEIFVGCGITKDSIPENEFVETVNKSLTMKKVIL